MGFVTEQYEERKAKLDADSAAYDPNYLIAKESGQESGGEAPAPAPEAVAAEEPDPNTAGESPEGYEEQHQPEQ